MTARKAKLGMWTCTGLVIGNMVGSGIFLLPAALGPLGPVALFGWLVTSAGAIALALVFGRLARIVPETGGPYAYTRTGFGDFAGFLVAWGYWIALWSGNAAVSVAFAGYLGYFLPVIGVDTAYGAIAALAALWLVTMINTRGVGEAGLVCLVTTVLKLLPLLLVASMGLLLLDTEHLSPLNPGNGSIAAAIAASAALTLWAFLGLESATVPAGDVDRPDVTIPRATILGTVIAAVLYIAVTLAAFGTIAPADLADSTAPLADVARDLLGPWGGTLVALGACVATFGTLNGFTLLTGQVPLGAARDGVFPAVFARLSSRQTPATALVASNALASVLIAMNFSKGLVEQFTFIILLATLTSLVPYLLCALAELMILAREPSRYRAPRGLARTVALSAVAFLYAAWAIYGAGAEIVFYGFLLLIAGIPVFVWVRWRANSSELARAEERSGSLNGEAARILAGGLATLGGNKQ